MSIEQPWQTVKELSRNYADRAHHQHPLEMTTEFLMKRNSCGTLLRERARYVRERVLEEGIEKRTILLDISIWVLLVSTHYIPRLL